MSRAQDILNAICDRLGHDHPEWEHTLTVHFQEQPDGSFLPRHGMHDWRPCHRCGGSFTQGGMTTFPPGERVVVLGTVNRLVPPR